MRRSLRVPAVAALAAAALALPAASAAGPTTTTASFDVAGLEYAFTSTVGSFAGTASGAGGSGLWNARVVHDQLGSPGTIYVEGGSFSMVSTSLGRVSGSFTPKGGTITLEPGGTGCSNQHYDVTGALQNVSTSGSSGGSGTFGAVLTHYRVSLFGSCITYGASVTGEITLSA